MDAEISSTQKANEILQAKVKSQFEEIDVLAKILKSNRAHFKYVEKADFETLKEQLKAYEEKVAAFKVDETKIAEFRAKRAIMKIHDNEAKLERETFNGIAKKRNFPQAKKSLAEMVPRDVFEKQIDEIVGPTLMDKIKQR